MESLKFLLALIGYISPPASDADQRTLNKWRRHVSSAILTLAIIVTLGYALALGILTFIFPGFALASDLEKQVQVATQIRIEQLDTKLFDTRGRQCAAILNKNPAALRSETERLQDKLNEYQDVAKKLYRVPSCEEY